MRLQRVRSGRAVLALVAVPTLALALAAGPASAQTVTWNFSQAHITPAAQSSGHGGRGVTVAVIDTWVQASHPDFGGRVLQGADCSSGLCAPGLAQPDGCEAHGTHVAGTIASGSYGVAPEATILPLRVLAGDTAADCSTTPQAVAAAIDYAVAAHAQVITVALGGDQAEARSQGLADAVARAAVAGDLVVFAAGDSGQELTQAAPADALVIAATGPAGTLAGYSQYGAGISLAAPGGEQADGSTCTVTACVLSTWGDGQFAALAGTSMSAAHVAGAAALLIAQNPYRSRTRIMTILENSAHPLADAGSGLLDVTAALRTDSAQTTGTQPGVVAGSGPSLVAPTPTTGVATPSVPLPVLVGPGDQDGQPLPAVTAPVVDPPASPLLDAPVAIADPSSAKPNLPLTTVAAAWLLLVGAGLGWYEARRRLGPEALAKSWS